LLKVAIKGFSAAVQSSCCVLAFGSATLYRAYGWWRSRYSVTLLLFIEINN